MLQTWFPVLLKPSPLISQLFGRSSIVQLHHQPLFSPHRNWMSATELSRILMRVVSESKLLTWGVGIERRPRNGGAECSQTPSATIRLEMSEFITSGLACPQSVGTHSKLMPHLSYYGEFFGTMKTSTKILLHYNHCSKSEMFSIISLWLETCHFLHLLKGIP